MELLEINKPNKPENGEIMFGTYIPPIDRLNLFSPDDFEALVHEWAYECLSQRYHSVFQIGGAGDRGRDIVAHLDDTRVKIDIYQCKHYGGPLSPSEFWIEFGKLCYYTFRNDYPIPQNYYIVTSKGLGPSMKNYLDNPHTINKDLKENWNTYCRKKITKTEEIILNGDFEEYVDKFNFGIVIELSPIQLIDEYSKTKWFKYRFGGGLKKRPKFEIPPIEIADEERKLPYVTQLLSAYSQHAGLSFGNIESLKSNKILSEHFVRQRVDYHSAQSLSRFSRDEFIDEDPYTEAKEEIFNSVIDTALEPYQDGFERVKATLSEARKIPLDGNELGKINPGDKSGMCHELVNDLKLKWVE